MDAYTQMQSAVHALTCFHMLRVFLVSATLDTEGRLLDSCPHERKGAFVACHRPRPVREGCAEVLGVKGWPMTRIGDSAELLPAEITTGEAVEVPGCFI